MSRTTTQEFHILKSCWSLFILVGLFSLAFGGIYVMVVPLSDLFWPGEPYHALEMGILITFMFWISSISGILFGRLIDKYSRTKILFLVAIIRGISMIMLGFTIVGRGIESWTYFFIFTSIIGFSAGGNYPTVVALSDDMAPLTHRSRFFVGYQIARFSFQLIGFLLTGVLILFELWRLFFFLIGFVLLIQGLVFYLVTPEPKRGSQRKELSDILKDEKKTYKYQMDLKMMRKTMLSKTNLVALVEGIFTSVFMGSLTILFLPYIQSPPHNVSPLATGAFLALFGFTLGILLRLIFAKLSDKFAKKNFIRRIHFILISLLGGSITFVMLFLLPLPHLTPEEGENLLIFFSFPIIWVMSIMYVSSSSLNNLYHINQPPIIQEINLPEAQGQIIALNRLLESIGFGSGPLITGFLILITGQNYQLAALLIGIFAIPGIILWSISSRWYPNDRNAIRAILEERSKELT